MKNLSKQEIIDVAVNRFNQIKGSDSIDKDVRSTIVEIVEINDSFNKSIIKYRGAHKMKTILVNTISEMKKSYTTFSIVLIFIAAVSLFFTKIQIFENDSARTVLQILYVASSGIGLMILLLPILAYTEEYLQTTKFSKFSIASLFIKNSNHAAMNLKTLLFLISAAYAVFAVTTGQFFAASLVIWFITWLALMFA